MEKIYKQEHRGIKLRNFVYVCVHNLSDFNMTKIIKNYTEAVKELEDILRELEDSDEVNMDSIAEKVKRASSLMQYCKNKLHGLDEELERVLSDTNID